MKKKIVSMMLAGAMAVSLAGCGGGADKATTAAPAQGSTGAEQSGEKAQTTEDKKEESGEKTVITVWTMDRHDSEYVESKIEEFNANNDKGIEISLNVITDDYPNMMALAYS